MPKAQLHESVSFCKDIGSHCWRLPSNCPCKEQQQVVDGGGGRRTQLNGGPHALSTSASLGNCLQALVGAAVAPGNSRTQKLLQDETHRPPEARSPIDPSILEVKPQEPFNLDVDLLLKNLRTAAAGTSGMTAEHSKPLLADTTCTRLFGEVAGQFARDARGGITGGESWSDDSFDQARRRSARHGGR